MEEIKNPTPRELLKQKADLLGIEYKSNTPDAKLIEMINAKIQSTNRELKTDNEVLSDAISRQKRELTKLRRVIVSCMDPGMKDWDTTPFLSFSNSIITLPTIVVPLNIEWHIPQAYYDLLKDQKCYISVRSRDIKGRPITVRKEINKYTIQDLPPLTTQELLELKQAQIMRDGLQ